MARVLILSSFVACGHVGLSAGQPVLQALGHAVTGLPTILLSNHPGFSAVAGEHVPVPHLQRMLEALAGNGWLQRYDAVLTGYLPSAGHVQFAAGMIDRIRAFRPDTRIVVDPVLGDTPKGLYMPNEAAEAIRDRLMPLADVLTPNAFELDWLDGAAGVSRVLVTSAEQGDQFGVFDTASQLFHRVERRQGVPHGVGDVFSALIAAGLPVPQALGHLQALIEASLGHAHLQIAEALTEWTRADPPEGSRNGL
ncbi:bifunctional hydroxymethylpyrimidine kinase/phosphomethylpyrimidine kinase [Sagittula sp. S175]|uniref:bifunctional hydroxymethylpyrimidine kinase/phosphomethylpyrimidine kinase n=1 Tax=Sagittula sp. S175 TaxID=3415129 RepID=UPI003C7E8F33